MTELGFGARRIVVAARSRDGRAFGGEVVGDFSFVVFIGACGAGFADEEGEVVAEEGTDDRETTAGDGEVHFHYAVEWL